MKKDFLFKLYKKHLINKFNKKWAGKELLFCPHLYSELNFTYSMVRACTMCTLEPFTPPIFYVAKNHDYSKLNLKEYLKHLDRIMTWNQTEKAVCTGCYFLKKQIVPKLEENGNIKRFSFNHFTKCNADCIYCTCIVKTQDVPFKILPILKRFEEYKLFNKDIEFNWAGGEPTICGDFDECCEYLYEKKYKQLINTSGIKYSPLVEKCLKNNLAHLMISPDSGTKETYLKVKRVDCFDIVWENIKKYATITNNFTVKYVFFSMNANETDVREFINRCVWAGVKSIAITVENDTARGKGEKFGSITDQEINMAILMKKLAIENNISYTVWHMWKDENKKRIEEG